MPAWHMIFSDPNITYLHIVCARTCAHICAVYTISAMTCVYKVTEVWTVPSPCDAVLAAVYWWSTWLKG